MSKRIILPAMAVVLVAAVVVCAGFLGREGPAWTIQELDQLDVLQMTWSYTREPDPQAFNSQTRSVQFAYGVWDGYQSYAGAAAVAEPISSAGYQLGQSELDRLPGRWLTVSISRAGSEGTRSPYHFDLYQVEDAALLTQLQEAVVEAHGRHFLCLREGQVLRVDRAMVYFICNTFRDELFLREGMDFPWTPHYQPDGTT